MPDPTPNRNLNLLSTKLQTDAISIKPVNMSEHLVTRESDIPSAVGRKQKQK